MATTLKNAQQQSAAAREERARDAVLAMQEYEAQRLNIQVKTARLRALRFAASLCAAHHPHFSDRGSF